MTPKNQSKINELEQQRDECTEKVKEKCTPYFECTECKIDFARIQMIKQADANAKEYYKKEILGFLKALDEEQLYGYYEFKCDILTLFDSQSKPVMVDGRGLSEIPKSTLSGSSNNKGTDATLPNGSRSVLYTPIKRRAK